MNATLKGISLFTGAGGMDIGFKKAGIDVVFANEINKDACNTYEVNHPNTPLYRGDIREALEDLSKFEDIDVLFGGPPCQGFSVAGKMDPNDERNDLVWTFLEAVKLIKPRAFVMENVKALAKLEKWKDVREKIYKLAHESGYSCEAYLLNSIDYGVPQKRERVFFIGFLNENVSREQFNMRLEEKKKIAKSVRETIAPLGPAGTDLNPLTCTAKVTLALNPIIRKSPYAGMLFNGMGRPLDLERASNTLPASMGGNKTPIVDEELLHGNATDNWMEEYHKNVIEKRIVPEYKEAPSRLRRLTTKEAALLQTFPKDYDFKGSKTAIYKQIGNAVPCLLAEVIASAVIEQLNGSSINKEEPRQLTLDDLMDTHQSVVIDIKDGLMDIY
ncbi:TPA: DNA cytosine methyltransferase [Bacillus pseudomycoides]|nr:DNA cytosine methyltransferase [Bacillus pseudomycoides]